MYLLEYICNEYGVSEFDANGLIMAGRVLINEQVCSWTKYKIKKQDVVRIRYKKADFVTRAGHKLEKAIKIFKLDIKGKHVIDIGASQGGFTDCLIKYGADRVYAVDVAYGLLDYRLRENERVIALERKNAKYLDDSDIPEFVDLITSDVSFISLLKVIPPNIRFLKEDGKVVLLFKPQFELLATDLGKNGMPIHNMAVVSKIEELVEELRSVGLFICKIAKSPIKGNSGNVEYLLLGQKAEIRVLEKLQIEECVLT